MDRAALTQLEDIPNIGPAIAEKLRRVDVQVPSDLVGRDPYALFDEFGARTGGRPDPCLLDVFISATRFMDGEPEKPWWTYTAERKAKCARDGCSQAEGALGKTLTRETRGARRGGVVD